MGCSTLVSTTTKVTTSTAARIKHVRTPVSPQDVSLARISP